MTKTITQEDLAKKVHDFLFKFEKSIPFNNARRLSGKPVDVGPRGALVQMVTDEISRVTQQSSATTLKGLIDYLAQNKPDFTDELGEKINLANDLNRGSQHPLSDADLAAFNQSMNALIDSFAAQIKLAKGGVTQAQPPAVMAQQVETRR